MCTMHFNFNAIYELYAFLHLYNSDTHKCGKMQQSRAYIRMFISSKVKTLNAYIQNYTFSIFTYNTYMYRKMHVLAVCICAQTNPVVVQPNHKLNKCTYMY